MENNYYDDFEKNWKKFVTRLQGQLLTQVKKGVFNMATFNLILDDCVGFWDSKHTEGGRWLDNYEKEYPQKAELIRDILLKDMKFEEGSVNSSQQGYLKYAIPAGSAAAGLIVSKLAGASPLIQAACTIVPAVLAYPVSNGIAEAADESRKKEVIRSCIEQLDKYKAGISSILQEI